MIPRLEPPPRVAERWDVPPKPEELTCPEEWLPEEWPEEVEKPEAGLEEPIPLPRLEALPLIEEFVLRAWPVGLF